MNQILLALLFYLVFFLVFLILTYWGEMKNAIVKYTRKLLNEQEGLQLRIHTFFIILLVIFAFPAILLCLTYLKNGLKLENAGNIGDVISGLTSPVIGLTAIILTFAAFWVQFQANQEQKRQFLKQSFENHFFELLKRYEDTVNNLEMEQWWMLPCSNEGTVNLQFKSDLWLKGYNGTTIIKGRNVFKSLFEELWLFASFERHRSKTIKKLFRQCLIGIAYENDNQYQIEDYDNRIKSLTPCQPSREIESYFAMFFLTLKYVQTSKIILEEEKKFYIEILTSSMTEYEHHIFWYYLLHR